MFCPTQQAGIQSEDDEEDFNDDEGDEMVDEEDYNDDDDEGMLDELTVHGGNTG